MNNYVVYTVSLRDFISKYEKDDKYWIKNAQRSVRYMIIGEY